MPMTCQKKLFFLSTVMISQIGLWIACTSQEFSSDNQDPSYNNAPASKSEDSKNSSAEALESKNQVEEDLSQTSQDSPTAMTENNSGTTPGSSPPPGQGNSQLSPPAATSSSNVVQFVIPKGTGAGPWNTAQNPIRVKVGQTLEVVNEDTIRHQFHTNGRPFFHPFTAIAPGGKASYKIQSEFSGALYDHLNFGKIYLSTQ